MKISISSILGYSWCYNLFSRAVGGKEARGIFVREFVRPKGGDKILDIGCGTAEILDHLPQVNYHGIDNNLSYIVYAQKQYGDRGYFQYCDVQLDSLRRFEDFDIVMATGLLHHLPDKDVSNLFHEVSRILKPGGRFITLDGCRRENLDVAVNVLFFLDRGKFIRSENEYINLIPSAFSTVRSFLQKGLLKIPYEYIILECVK